MSQMECVLGLDIGGTNMRFGLIDAEYQISDFEMKRTSLILDATNPIANIIDGLKDYCNVYLKNRKLKAISIGFPSTIDKTRKVVLSTPNIKGLQNIPVANHVSNSFNIPTFINKDVNFLLLYDMYSKKIENSGIVLGCYFGTGLGNAISIDGKLLIGKNGVASELGHIPVLNSDLKCGCGNIGCIEMYASGKHLEELVGQNFKDTFIKQVFTNHLSEPVIEQYMDILAIPIATEINILDPDYIIIGGGVLQMANFPKHKLVERILAHTRKPFPAENLNILYSDEAQENGVIGAGIYAYKRFESEDYL